MKKKKIIINIFLVCTIVIIIIWLGIEENKDKKIEEDKQQTNNNYTAEKQEIVMDNVKEEEKEIKQYPKEKIEEQYQGYDVCAKLEIPEILLQTYILKNYSMQALNVAVTKFWGVEPNQIGNFCVAGHNFPNRNMFYKLKKLKVGDKLFLSDNNVGKIEYEIYDIYKVLPNDVNCLNEETGGKREITLITCTNDSKQRIIVKAREKENY